MLLKSGLHSSVFIIDKLSSNYSIYKYKQFHGMDWSRMKWDWKGSNFFCLIASPHETFFLVLDCASAGNKKYLNIYFLVLYPTFCSGA